ncbi:MAG: hypothetical protein ABF285_08745 [Pacificibacter sp.]|uniref:hypothetical protein n=1 Tax=Pacificibacter sp. TaxID=1917866 RepID=UPI003219E84D
MMTTCQLIKKLEAALECAQAHNITAMNTILDAVRDGSYDLSAKQSAFFVRAACAAVEHVSSALDPLSSIESAMAAIKRVKDTAPQSEGDLTAA